MRVRDRLDGLWCDEDFADRYPRDGRRGFSPAQPATICVLQFLRGLSDRRAAEAVRCRIDFTYALAVELDELVHLERAQREHQFTVSGPLPGQLAPGKGSFTPADAPPVAGARCDRAQPRARRRTALAASARGRLPWPRRPGPARDARKV
ncbi:transposase [Streptomyces sp. NPDC054765]